MVDRIRSDLTRRTLLTCGGAAMFARPVSADERVVVFAAASLKPALDQIAKGWDVALSYGGTGALARQVAAGAPADVVILAATDWMDWLVAQGVLAGPPRPVARNRLVLAGVPGGGGVGLAPGVILSALEGGRMAMGDPMSVPAGRYAQQAFETLGVWEALSERLVLTQDVRAALAYVVRGDVALGAVYRSDAFGTGVSIAATIPATAHAPILYPAACVRDRAPAKAFLDHVAASTEVFTAYGFAA